MTKHKYTKAMLEGAVLESKSYSNVLRVLGIPPAGGNQSHIKRRIVQEGIDVSHFTGQGWNAGGRSPKRLTAADILVLRKPDEPKTKTALLRRGLLEIGRLEECVECGVGAVHNGKPLVLEIDHINGQSWDNREGNLRFLCPNCHSQQETNKPWKNKVGG